MNNSDYIRNNLSLGLQNNENIVSLITSSFDNHHEEYKANNYDPAKPNQF